MRNSEFYERGIALSNEGLQMFLGLVSCALVSVEREQESEVAELFLHQPRLWEERLIYEGIHLTPDEQSEVSKLREMLHRLVEKTADHWDELT